MVRQAVGRVPHLHRDDDPAAAGDLRDHPPRDPAEGDRLHHQPRRRRLPAAPQAPVRPPRRRRAEAAERARDVSWEEIERRTLATPIPDPVRPPGPGEGMRGVSAAAGGEVTDDRGSGRATRPSRRAAQDRRGARRIVPRRFAPAAQGAGRRAMEMSFERPGAARGAVSRPARRSPLDGPLDVVAGHGYGAGLVDGVPELEVRFGVAAAGRAAMMMYRESLLNSLARAASCLPLRTAMFAEWECPAMSPPRRGGGPHPKYFDIRAGGAGRQRRPPGGDPDNCASRSGPGGGARPPRLRGKPSTRPLACGPDAPVLLPKTPVFPGTSHPPIPPAAARSRCPFRACLMLASLSRRRWVLVGVALPGRAVVLLLTADPAFAQDRAGRQPPRTSSSTSSSRPGGCSGRCSSSCRSS